MKTRLLLAYLLLLLASHAVRAGKEPAAPGAGVEVAELDAVDGEGVTVSAGGVRMIWRERVGEGSEPRGEPVVLLHGSPGAKTDLSLVARGLSHRRTLSPDLPGFGRSEASVPDYSVRAHADYVLQLLDHAGIERAHLVGFSMGGGVALEMGRAAPDRVLSLTMVSAIGVQELELFGDYTLNHLVHGFQLAGLLAIHEGLPHFGLLDGSFLSVAYARNFFDTDQRPLRAVLERWEGPVLILHGKDDPLVPVAAAEEHARLLPQSELEVYDGSHFLVFRRGEELGRRIEEFLGRVESGAATVRSEAPPERVARAAAPFDPASVPPLSGLGLVLFLVLAALSTLVSEDLTCVAVGALVGQGRVDFWPGAAACFVGIYVGDLLLFLAGRVLGRRTLDRAPLRWFLDEARVERSSAWFERRGPIVIFLSRFMPGMRLPTYFASGVLRTSVWRFSFWFALAAATWTPILVWISSRIGGALSERVDFLRRDLALVLLATLLLGLFLVKVVRPAVTHRGRRRLLGSWRRLTHWEFWPPWVFYPPIVLYCLWQGLRHRSLTVFSAVNPGMPHGGFIGESKSEILDGLAAGSQALGGPASRALPRSVRVAAGLPAAERVSAAHQLQSGLDEPWPIVVKPDVGQRGEGVHVVRTESELRGAFDGVRGDALVQEYVPGSEYGLFYARRPDEARGRLISVTRKELPRLTADGVRNIEDLILDDERAVCMARTHCAHNVQRLDHVPAAGEEVLLGELGTHCRGATFLDGAELETPELVESVDGLARHLPGFFFGRFDVRAESPEELRAGRFRVLELNGVTSEAAHVYDPRHSLLYAWRTIGAQWRLAYEIGAANAARGAPTSRVVDLVRAVLDYRRSEKRAALLARDGENDPVLSRATGA